MDIAAALNHGLSHYNAGRLAEAETLFRQVLAVQANNADALQMLGLVAHRVGRHADAAELMRRAVTIAPHVAEYHNNLGEALRALGQIDDAIAAYRRAIAINPGLAAVHFNLGAALAWQRELDAGLAHLGRGLELEPKNAAAWNNAGEILRAAGRMSEAAECCRRAIQFDADLAPAYTNLARVLHALAELDDANAMASRGVELAPTDPAAYVTLGNILFAQGRAPDALICYRRAHDLQPADGRIHFNIAMALRLIGLVDDSITAYRRGIELVPDAATGHSGLLLTLHYPSGIDAQMIFNEHVEWNRRYTASIIPFVFVRSSESQDASRRLRVGYVSPDFRMHSVGFFLDAALTLPRDRFEVFCYADEFRTDEVTRRLQSHAHRWRNVLPLSDEQLAQQIREDRIDILIDLAGHTADNRLLTFARRAAPVQATWLGYPDTTGLTTIDWRITDGVADPVGMTESLHTERLTRLDCAWCYRPPEDAPEPGRLRDDDVITFASFNSLPKISAATIELWSNVLKATPRSRLMIKASTFAYETVRRRYLDAFAAHGIAAERLELAGASLHFREHLASYAQVDIALDTFPYNGTTTTCEALWMGVPVVTLEGRTHVARVGASLLSAAGMRQYVADDPNRYVEIASEVASRRDQFAAERPSMRDRIARSSLTNSTHFTENLASVLKDLCAM